MKIVIIGSSSPKERGHAETYGNLISALVARGHHVRVLERASVWPVKKKEAPSPALPHATEFYTDLGELRRSHEKTVGEADLVILGSFTAEGESLGRWIFRTAGGATAFYDHDISVTLAALDGDGGEHLSRELLPRFHFCLSSCGGPILEILEKKHGARKAVAFHCTIDPECYSPRHLPSTWDLGFLGAPNVDRKPALKELLFESALRQPQRRFVAAAAEPPAGTSWPSNMEKIDDLPPSSHADFYASLRYALILAPRHAVRTGWSPPVRLLQAAACGIPVISDPWDGLESFFTPGKEILVARNSRNVEHLLSSIPDAERCALGERARLRFLAEHAPECRAVLLEELISSFRRRETPVQPFATADPLTK